MSLRDLQLGDSRVVVSRGGNWPAASRRNVVAAPVAWVGPGEAPRIRLFGAADEPADVPGTLLESGSAIAPGITHYVLWSPTAGSLALVQPRDGSLELRLWTHGMPQSRRLVAGAPIFASFSDDGSRLAIHHGGMDGARLTVVDMTTGEPGGVRLVRHGVGGFGTPGFARGGQVVAWAEPSGTRLRLRAADLAAGRIIDGPPVEGQVRFIPGPQGDELGVAVVAPGEAPMFDRLLAWAPLAGSVRTVHRGRFLAAWRSPGPDLVALALPGFSIESRIHIAFCDASGRELGRLEPFVPSPAMQLALAFFDQFGRSHNPWSPDGTWFVVGGRVLRDGPFPLFGPPEPDRIMGVCVSEAGIRPLRWQVLADGTVGWVL